MNAENKNRTRPQHLQSMTPAITAGGFFIREAKRLMEPTQIEHPWRAVVRTCFQAFVGLCALLPLVLATDTPPAGEVAVALAAAAAVTRVMAIPKVNVWLSRYFPWLAADEVKR